jgi:protein-tyrosine kinase
MSFIEKALEVAKVKGINKEVVPKPGETTSNRDPSWPADKDFPSFLEPVREICYTNTRTVQVDLNTLIRNRLLVGSPNTTVVQSYKLLRTHVLQQTFAEHRNALMMTGALPDEGKTLTTINLALSIAQEFDRTVLLVDADLHGPSIHRFFGLPTEKGLVDYLEGRNSIPELLVHPQGLERLVILPAGKPTYERASELIRSRRMADLVSDLKHYYPDRYVFFDLPPLLSFADSLAFAPLVDGILLVVRARKTGREDLARCLEMLSPFRIIGYVFNDVEFLDSSRYYSPNGNQKNRWLSWLRINGQT